MRMARGDHGNNSVTLGPRDSLTGALTFDGDITIQGKVEGEIRVTGDVAIGDAAHVQASVEGNHVNVQGNLTGNVTARGRLALSGSGSVHGDVRVSKLSVEDGATLNGNVSMGQAAAGGRGGDRHSEAQNGREQVAEQQMETVG
jgi:cytoskeletal protein CcmA (bactofilin family)